MKIKTLIYVTFIFLFICKPKIVNGQVTILFDILYEINFLFGFEGEPRAVETDFSSFPYDLYDDGRYRPIDIEGVRVSTKAQILLQSNDRDVFGGLAQIQFSPISTITLDLNHRHLFEGRNISESNGIAISNFSFQYNRIRNRQFNLWWNVGTTRFEEADDSEWGVSGGLGFSWFFRQPLSLHIGYKYHEFFDFVGDISSFDIRIQLHLKRYFISGGYQNLSQRISANTWLLGGGVYF